MTDMTKALLKKLCKDNGLYTTPHINDKLYLHYKGFNSICNLEEYVALRALWLEGNGLNKIEGLDCLKELRTLYLHENIIDKIEGLDNQFELDNLNLSKNFIQHIENLSHMSKLTCLNLANNRISTTEAIIHLLDIPSLQTVDLQHNKIEETSVIEIFAKLPDLRVLYLMGNPVVKKISNYRKTIVSKCKNLKYLDDRPVFEEERRRTNAWAKVLENGGTYEEAQEAERMEIKLIRQEKDEADERNFRAFEQLMIQGKEIRRQREEQSNNNNTASATNNVLDNNRVVEEINPFSGETIINVPESEELRKIREARWCVPLSEQHENKNINCYDDTANIDFDMSASNTALWKEVYANTQNTQESSVLVEATEVGISEEKNEPSDEIANNNDVVSVKKSKFLSLLDESIQEVGNSSTLLMNQIDMEELD